MARAPEARPTYPRSALQWQLNAMTEGDDRSREAPAVTKVMAGSRWWPLAREAGLAPERAPQSYVEHRRTYYRFCRAVKHTKNKHKQAHTNTLHLGGDDSENTSSLTAIAQL